ncbi:MAG TPA: Glu/Leu/Phe/Val dehydrogenase dimerization domain-containing protein [Caulobacteraceae bacterium]|nr:Glu/Leu/Phe/Val dehydrogenase dimerization domain-containing protein [Caulobacteraceae bacterium]
MSVFDSAAYEGHEALHAFYDQASGLKCFIAIHSTALGPAAGGCRMWTYAGDQAAIDDALRLSRAMSYKNAVADIPLGGGKAVILGDPRKAKTPALFEALGDRVESLGGLYWGAEDVGVSPADLAHAAKRTRFMAGLEGEAASSGDPSPVTAEGIKRGIELCVQRVMNRSLNGVTVAVQGLGHVGGLLARKLKDAGARLIVTDLHEDVARRVGRELGAEVVPPATIFDAQADVFAPCALGGAINRESLAHIRAKIIAGGANNQLADAEIGQAVFDRGIVYAPDFVINGGGIINVAAEIMARGQGTAYDPAWVEARLGRLMDTLGEVLQRSAAERRPADRIAVEIARERIAAAKR